jgi:CheY-like chemotaxis protein
VLKRPELLKDDGFVREISSRQRYDWRVQADPPPNDPQIRRAVRELAEKIAAAIARTTAPAPAPEPQRQVEEETAREVSSLVLILRGEGEKTKARRLVLWVDDRPDNNMIERQSMGAYNIDFVLARSTGEALAELRKNRFHAIISDMGRPPDARAGYTLLEALRASGDQTPYFIYSGSRAAEQVREALSRGAQGSTNRMDELLQMLLEAVNV